MGNFGIKLPRPQSQDFSEPSRQQWSAREDAAARDSPEWILHVCFLLAQRRLESQASPQRHTASVQTHPSGQGAEQAALESSECRYDMLKWMPAHYNQHITVCYIYYISSFEFDLERLWSSLNSQLMSTSNVITSATRNNIAYWSLFMAFIVDYWWDCY